MEFTLITLLNGLSYGLMLFMLSAGLSLIYSLMGVLNFAHASLYMLGAYFAYSLQQQLGFAFALVLAPLLVAMLGAIIERFGLRALHQRGQVAQLLFTFGLAYLVLELVQLFWGRAPLNVALPDYLQGPLFSLYGSAFPKHRALMIAVAFVMLLLLAGLLYFTRAGLIVQAALSQPQMTEALGHRVPTVMTLVFALGCGLAGLAGVVGGQVLLTEPGMAASLGSLLFVVVVAGGLGSLAGAFWASLLIGVAQTFAVAWDYSLLGLLRETEFSRWIASQQPGLLALSIAQLAPVLPYLLMIMVLLFRPQGLAGRRA